MTAFYIGNTDVTSGLEQGGGELGGDLQARDGDIPAALSSLDNLAYTISTSVNAQQASGTDFDGNPGAPIFAQPTEIAGSALSMSMVMGNNPNGIAAAAGGSGANSGDNTNASVLAGLQNTAQAQLNGLSPNSYYSDFVTSLGSTVSEVQTENTAQQTSVSQLQTQRNSLSEVNLNDEAASLTSFERSYQAASQFFTIIDSVMASALNLGEQSAVS